ncbi:MAG: DUF4230 domain-containing protein [Actinomycetes bacterium]
MSSRFLPTFGGLIRLMLFVAVLAVLVVGAANIPGAVGDKVDDILSDLNPFDEETTDRTGPSVLNSLTELSEFKAAGAYYETVVDLEKDTNNVPDFIRGERVLYVGKGEVESTVDFSELDERKVDLSEDGTSVTVSLPKPTVGEPQLNLKTSYFADREKGFIDRFEGSDLEQKAQLKAIENMTTAATGADNLIDLAEESTRKMLQGLFGSLGYTDININFDK